MILSTYHSLCGLIFGQGLKEDIDIALTFENVQDLDQKSGILNQSTKSLSDINYLSEREEKTLKFLQTGKDSEVEHSEEEEEDEHSDLSPNRNYEMGS
jgi:hypothetical protein